MMKNTFILSNQESAPWKCLYCTSLLSSVREECLQPECRLHFESIFISFFFSFSLLLQTIKAAHPLCVSWILIFIYGKCHFLHRLLSPSLLTLSVLLTLSHRCWCQFAGEKKGERTIEGGLLLLHCLPEGGQCLPLDQMWSSTNQKKTAKTHELTHDVDTGNHRNTLFIHTILSHPFVFFSFTSTRPITTTNHKCKSQGHECNDNGKSKWNLLFVQQKGELKWYH